MYKRQRGISLIGTLIIAVFVIGSLILGMRTVPVYNEYFAVKKAVVLVAAGGEAQTPQTIRSAFQRHADVNDIETVSGKDLDISKDGNRYVVSVQWERRIPLVANVALVFSFEASSLSNPASSE